MGLKCGDRPTVDARAQGRLTEQVPKVRPSHESSPLERVLGRLRTDRKTRGGHSECGPQDQASLTLPRHPPSQSIFVDPSLPQSKKRLSLVTKALFAWRLDLRTRDAIAFKSSYWNFINQGRLNIKRMRLKTKLYPEARGTAS